jgi:hypothetical protein
MRKLITSTLFLFFICSAISAQTAYSVKPTDYSESVSYQPREFKFKSSKPEKQKKAKKENKEKIVSPVAEPPAAEVSLIKEDKFLNLPVAIFDAKGGAVLNLKK